MERIPQRIPIPMPDYGPPSYRDLERWDKKPKIPKKSPWAPQIEQRDPAKVQPSLPLRALKRVPFLAVLIPDPVADATFDEGPFYWQEEGFSDLAIKRDINPIPQVEIPPVRQNDFLRIPEYDIPEVPFQNFAPDIGPAITRSPRKKSVYINVPDIIIPPPYLGDIAPDLDIWSIPDNDIPIRMFDPHPHQIPEVDTLPRKEVGPQLKEVAVNILVQTQPNPKNLEQPLVTVKFVPTTVRASRKKRKDTKANRRWIKAAHKFINLTYGTYSEAIDAMEVIAWNAYVEIDGKRIPAMVIEKGSLLKVMQGIGEGKYELDLGKTIIDYVMMQSMDYLQGRFSQRIVGQSTDQGWWTSPQGPTSFVNNMNNTIKGL